MLSVKELLLADDLDAPEDRIKLVRHVDRAERSIRQMIAEGHFELYQPEQVASGKNLSHGCGVILSFPGPENTSSLNQLIFNEF